MKKVLIILIVTIVSVSLFAADIKATVKMNPVFDKYGFRLEVGSLRVDFSASTDKAEASGSTVFSFNSSQNKKGIGLTGKVLFKPSDKIKIETGLSTQIALGKGLDIIPSDTFCYAGFEATPSNKANFLLQIGALMPYDYEMQNNKYYYVTNLDFGYNKFFDSLVGHIDSRGKLSFENGNLKLHMFRATAKYSPSSWVFSYNNYGRPLSELSGCYGHDGSNTLGWCDDSSFLKYVYRGQWYETKEKFYSTDYRVFRIALTYQYSENYPDYDNGLLLDLYFKDLPLKKITSIDDFTEPKGSFITLGTELSFKKFDVELGYHYCNTTGHKFNNATNVQMSLIYNKNGKVDFNVPYVVNESRYVGDGFNYFSRLEYKHSKDDISGNGVFLTVNPTGNVGVCGWDFTAYTGFDGKQLKDYKLSSNFQIEY